MILKVLKVATYVHFSIFSLKGYAESNKRITIKIEPKEKSKDKRYFKKISI